jgi:hypothetical protein
MTTTSRTMLSGGQAAVRQSSSTALELQWIDPCAGRRSVEDAVPM